MYAEQFVTEAFMECMFLHIMYIILNTILLESV